MAKILVYLGATMPADQAFTNAVQDFGAGIAKAGHTLIFGGSNEGTMRVLADAFTENGGNIVGVFTKELPPSFLRPGLTETVVAENLSQRKTIMFNMADAIVAFPGSFGTWDELFDAVERVKIEVMHDRPAKPMAVLNLKGYYDGVAALLKRSVQEGYTTDEYAGLLHSEDTVEGMLAWLPKA